MGTPIKKRYRRDEESKRSPVKKRSNESGLITMFRRSKIK